MSLQSAIFKEIAFLRKTNDDFPQRIAISLSARKETMAHDGMQKALVQYLILTEFIVTMETATKLEFFGTVGKGTLTR